MIKNLVTSQAKDREIRKLRETLVEIMEMLENCNGASAATEHYIHKLSKETLKESLQRIPKLS